MNQMSNQAGASWSSFAGWLLVIGFLMPIISFKYGSAWVWDMFDGQETKAIMASLFIAATGVAAILLSKENLADAKLRGMVLLGLVAVMVVFVLAEGRGSISSWNSLRLPVFGTPFLGLLFIGAIVLNFVSISFIRENPSNPLFYMVSAICGLAIIAVIAIPQKTWFLGDASPVEALFDGDMWKRAWSSNLFLLGIIGFAVMSVMHFMKKDSGDEEFVGNTMLIGTASIVLFPMLFWLNSIIEDGGFIRQVTMVAKVIFYHYGIAMILAAGLLSLIPALGLNESKS